MTKSNRSFLQKENIYNNLMNFISNINNNKKIIDIIIINININKMLIQITIIIEQIVRMQQITKN